ncbi:hypothetical protein PanWU01x14_324880, partial [Parasponia andersonii]
NSFLEKLESVHRGCQAPPPSLVVTLLNPVSRIYSQLDNSLDIENTKKNSQENEEKKLRTNYTIDIVEEIKKWSWLEHFFIFFFFLFFLSFHGYHSLFLSI